ncbi:crossover junction endodeoxyribonuclease RuvC [Seleniivibrio woodruffii]|uniref:crossover junction endodeoxyribonuclease RuvC n=1 Tax=Seleniivibrio woodruffii TaxID=1078050 RepID=UPI00240A22A2|nr:crossover junction endodeoxyribonuclease RuvC [Seleniivibrio woodruffii]
MPAIVMGVDPGLNCTGIGIVQVWPGKVEYVAHKVVRTDSKETLPQRLAVICQGVREAVDEFKPSYSAVEDVFYSVNVKSAMLLGQTRGAIIATLLSSGLEVREFTALQIKKAVVGYGKADKAQVKHMVEILLGRKIGNVPMDATDALACGICLGLNLTGRFIS